VRGLDHAIIAHPPGAETQFDWLELPNPPASWGLAGDAHLLVGALSHSGAWRVVLAESEDQPHLIAGLGQLSERLGGVTKRWRFDRMATVCHPATGKVTASFVAVAKHYGVGVDICPSRHGNRKGTVEKGNHSLAQRWWRTLGEDATPVTAQAGVDAFCLRADARIRRRDGHRVTVGALAGAEVLTAAPGLAFPAVATVSWSLPSVGSRFSPRGRGDVGGEVHDDVLAGGGLPAQSGGRGQGRRGGGTALLAPTRCGGGELGEHGTFQRGHTTRSAGCGSCRRWRRPSRTPSGRSPRTSSARP